MTDTHTHLYDSAYGGFEGSCAAVRRAIAAGVERLLLPAVDPSGIGPMGRLADAFPENVRLAMALHPTELGDDWQTSLSVILGELRTNAARYVAVGECGIDLYWDKTTLEAQMRVFDAQLACAAALSLPVLIHCREALAPTLEVLGGHPGVEAVFHSFGGTEADVAAIRRTGDYLFGINGIVTFRNSGLRGVLPAIGLDRILLETDSPYLSPAPHRGKVNESSRLPLIAEAVAQALGADTPTVAAATAANALRLVPGLA